MNIEHINNPMNLFTQNEHMNFEGIVSEIRNKAKMVPLLILYTIISSLLLVFLGVIDWEIYFRIFEYLGGDDGYWSPKLMAFSGIIMMIAFHILAKNQPKHVIARIVAGLTGLIIIAFIIGGGLYISTMLYGDGMGSMPDVEIPVVIGQISQSVAQQGWIDAVFENVTNPVAILSLSLGIGGLSIVALYIAHHLFTWINKNITEIYNRLSALRLAQAHHEKINQSEIHTAELHAMDFQLSFQDEQHWMLQISDEALEIIASNLMPHEQAYKEWEFNEQTHRWQNDESNDAKRIAAAIKKIKSITLSDIIKAMSLPKNLKRK